MIDFLTVLGLEVFDAFVRLWTQPFYLLTVVIIALHFRRLIALERKLFHARLHSVLRETGMAIVLGWIAGIAVSIVMAFFGAVIGAETLWAVWLAVVILALFRLRFVCFAYAAGVVGAAASLVNFFPGFFNSLNLTWLIEPLQRVNVPSLLALAAFLHLVEAFLMRTQGARIASPQFYQGKRGKLVGGYLLHGFWPVPLFLLVPISSAGMIPLPWEPLLGGEVWIGGWMVLPFPVMIGFAERTVSRLPLEKVKWSSAMLTVYAFLVLLLAVLVEWRTELAVLASVLTIMLHEFLVWYSRKYESQRTPLFVHDPRGLRILAVLPGSPAEEMGLVCGEIIHKVNGQKVATKEELHQALSSNAAYCKLEAINSAGESKFAKRAVYAGEHHQLGLILAPDGDAQYYIETGEVSLSGILARKWFGFAKKPKSM